jgi:hypothetical protein
MKVIQGDCVETMREMDEASVDAIVTDPPYGLEFMGKEWDRFRVDDPGTTRFRGDRAGGHGELDERDAESVHGRMRVGYGGGKRPTTNRCVGCGKRDQFRNPHSCPEGTEWRKEIIDPHAAPPTLLAFQEWSRIWATEALRVLKPGGHLLAFGGTRTYHRLACAVEDAGFEIRDSLIWLYGSGFPKSHNLNGDWQGWGTALKPAHEPIVVARKPLIGTVAQNVLEHGTGALNIDACRLGMSEADAEKIRSAGGFMRAGYDKPATEVYNANSADHPMPTIDAEPHSAGRWPANVALSHLPECERVGTRRVSTSDPRRADGSVNAGGFYVGEDKSGAEGMDKPRYCDPDGTEQVEAWRCVEGCPVRELDEQSGERPGFSGGGTKGAGFREAYVGGEDRNRELPAQTFGDTGGASRFFYVAKSSRAERTAGVGANAHPT